MQQRSLIPKMIHYQDEVQTQRKDKENVLRELNGDYFNLSQEELAIQLEFLINSLFQSIPQQNTKEIQNQIERVIKRLQFQIKQHHYNPNEQSTIRNENLDLKQKLADAELKYKAEYRNEYYQMQKQLDQYKSLLASKEEEIANSKDNESVSDISKKLNQANQQLMEISNYLQNQKKENSQNENVRYESKSKVDQLQSLNKTLQGQLDQRNECLKILEDQLDEINKRSELNKYSSEDINQYSYQIQKLQKIITQLEQKNKSLKSKLYQEINNRDVIENDYESKQRKLFKKIEELEFDKQQSSISNSFIAKESITSTSNNNNLHQELNDYKIRLIDYEDKIRKQNQQIEILENQLQMSVFNKYELYPKRKSSIFDNNRDELSRLDSLPNDRMENQLKEQNDNLQMELDRIYQSREQESLKLQQVLQENYQLQQKIKRQEIQLESLRQSLKLGKQSEQTIISKEIESLIESGQINEIIGNHILETINGKNNEVEEQYSTFNPYQ